jgi:two-component system NtrC family sensor kinase
VLKVISRSAFDLRAVLNTLVESAVTLSGGSLGTIFQRRGELFHLTAAHGYTPEMLAYGRANPLAPGPGSNVGRTAMTGTVVQIPDVMADPDYTALGYQRVGNFRAMLGIPIIREDKVEGVFSLAKPEPGLFEPRQVELVQTFADQAIIAIENARLFNEVQSKSRDLEESLQQQIATADVLKIISRSAFNLDNVLETLISTATRLCNCGPKGGQIFRREGDVYRYAASQMNVDPDYLRHEQTAEIKPGRGTLIGRVALSKRTVMIADAWSDPEYEEKDAAQTGNVRAMLGVPLLRDGEPIGAFALARSEPIAFTEREVELVTSFADQAVIAIENARLFNETREALDQQKASADILSVISNSVADPKPVFDKILRSIEHLFGGQERFIFQVGEDGLLHIAAAHGPNVERLRALFPIPVEGTANELAIRECRLVRYADVFNDPGVPSGLRETARRFGQNYSVVVAPMLWENRAIGSVLVGRTSMEAFSDKECGLLRTFADQAVIAIQNARMFEQVEAKTRELSQSLDDLRAAQDRLVQTEKLASLGQLTAGIAHEIKNPLNFVNNFSALSAELIDELDEALAPAPLDQKMRGDVGELTQMLKSNLDKVVQHGKRADSIVKNMLQHSREGSGEHRPANINAIVEESLNLAYHGARAEKAGFSIAFQRDLDPSVGMADIYPQEITRVLLNLISNGFYATTKRRAETGDGFEPILSATTKNLGDKVEIRIRDNGTGIPDEVKEKIFNPFFTTKPSGEGTGLGLSMSHDIIVKQHGGSIDVETEPGLFAEFKIVLPRASQR